MRRWISGALVLACGLAATACGGHGKVSTLDGGGDASGDAVTESAASDAGPSDAAVSADASSPSTFDAASDAGPPAEGDASVDAGGACTPLGAPPTGPRPSSLRAGDCDFGEQPDFVTFDLLCPDGASCAEPTQPGDQLCHRVCDDGLCAAGEQCEKRLAYVSDTPSRYANLCMCATGSCAPQVVSIPEGGLDPWQADAPLPLDLYYHAAAAGPGRLFVSGGLTIDHLGPGSSASLEAVDQVLGATLDADGRVTAWTAVGTLPVPRTFHAMAVAAGRLYLSGGGQQTFDASVSSAEIRPDGTLGPWRVEMPMPTGRSWHRLLAAGGVLVIAGGSESPGYFTNGTTRVAVAALGADGVVGPWAESFAPSPVYYDGGAGVAHGRLYVFGSDGVLRSAALPALDLWRPEATWPAIHSPLAPAVAPDINGGPVNLFEQCGALVAVLVRGQTLTAPLGADGAVGPWRVASRFHGADSGFAAAASDLALYASGGAVPGKRDADVWSTRRR
jgi:hypothetical protein